VLSLFAAIIGKLREAMADKVPIIFEAVFECTLQMITKNFEARAAASPCPACCHAYACANVCTCATELAHASQHQTPSSGPPFPNHSLVFTITYHCSSLVLMGSFY
jgi:hypothetical protein